MFSSSAPYITCYNLVFKPSISFKNNYYHVPVLGLKDQEVHASGNTPIITSMQAKACNEHWHVNTLALFLRPSVVMPAQEPFLLPVLSLWFSFGNPLTTPTLLNQETDWCNPCQWQYSSSLVLVISLRQVTWLWLDQSEARKSFAATFGKFSSTGIGKLWNKSLVMLVANLLIKAELVWERG